MLWFTCVLLLLGAGDAWVFASHEPLNAKVITDRAIEEHVARIGPQADGLDILPLSQVKAGGILHWAESATPATGLPQLVTGFISIQVFIQYSIERLVEIGLDGKLEGALAEAFEKSVDGQHIIFTLRRGVHWNDGIPFTSADVLFSLSLPFHCVLEMDEQTDGLSLEPLYKAGAGLRFSTDGGCSGLPGVLHHTAFIGPGPDGSLDTTPVGNDMVFGTRIVPAPLPLSLGQEGNNILTGESLETIPQGDDEIILLNQHQIALLWNGFVFDPLGFMVASNKICCTPVHILGESAADAVRLKDQDHLLERWNLNELEENPNSYVGTGPFKLAQFSPNAGGGATYVRNPFYWKVDEVNQPLPKLNGMRLIKTTNTNESFTLFLNGQTDIYHPESQELPSLQALAEQKNIRLFIAEGPVTTSEGVIQFNPFIAQVDPDKAALGIVFRNPEFRRAVSQAVDRQRIADEFFQGLQTARLAGHHPFHRDIESIACPASFVLESLQTFCDAFQRVKRNVSFDLEGARARLDGIGIIDRDGDGVRDVLSGFGFILPGPNGKLDTVPTGDDFVQAGLDISGLGLSDRDGDGNPDPDPGLIQPGPNGLLDTEAVQDDEVWLSPMPGEVRFTMPIPFGLDLLNRIFLEDFARIGFDVSSEEVAFSTFSLLHRNYILQALNVSNGFEAEPLNPHFEVGANQIGVPDNVGLGGQLLDTLLGRERQWGSPGSIDPPARREPYLIRFEEIRAEAIGTTDEVTLTRLHAEFQLLQAANMPRVFIWAEFNFPSGAVRKDRINAKAVPFSIQGVLNAELLFRLDLQ